MQIAISSLPGRSAPPPSTGDQAEGSGSDFANLLQQGQPPQAPADDIENNETSRPARQRNGSKPASRQAVAERPAAREAEAAAEPDAAARNDAQRSETTPPDRGLLDWLAALHMPAPAPAAAGGTAPLAVEAGTTATTGTLAPAGAPAAATALFGTDAAASLAGGARNASRDKATPGARTFAIQAEAAAAQPTAAASTSDTREAARFLPETPATVRTPTEAAPLVAPGAPATLPAAGGAASAPVAVPLATPLDDAQFPRAFGVQVSVLARDGVQQAELHLNPAEMGPVSVQIVMDGTQARIDFGADAAGTRQLIEHSLPDLAAALREAGLTLTGGGVSQHPSGRGDSGAAPGQHGESATAPGDDDTRPLRRSVRAGGVDLYA